MISGIIKVEVGVISRSQRLRLNETLIIPGITKTESNNCFIIHCFKENNDKRTVELVNCELDIAFGNHALRAQSRLVNNL